MALIVHVECSIKQKRRNNMKLTTVGTGSSNTVENFQTSYFMEFENGESLLFDCGDDSKFSMWNIGKTYKDIKAVYISHLHGDHVHGLEKACRVRSGLLLKGDIK